MTSRAKEVVGQLQVKQSRPGQFCCYLQHGCQPAISKHLSPLLKLPPGSHSLAPATPAVSCKGICGSVAVHAAQQGSQPLPAQALHVHPHHPLLPGRHHQPAMRKSFCPCQPLPLLLNQHRAPGSNGTLLQHTRTVLQAYLCMVVLFHLQINT